MSTYKMWYTGTNDPGDANWQIGYATSSDGTTWTRYGSNPLNLKGNATDWDGEGVGAPTVIYDSDAGIYKMWYVGWNGTQGYGIGYAESSDGISWTKYNNPSNNGDSRYANSDPVLAPGNPGSWDFYEAEMPSVIKDGPTYRMWYYGIESDGAPNRIGYAVSRDGISWMKYAGNPVMMNGQAASFDESGAYDPVVVKDGTTYKMWYIGSSSLGLDQVGYATSSAYNGPNPMLNSVSVVALNVSGVTPQLMFNVIPEGPSPIDMNALYVEGPNGFVRPFNESEIRDIMGEQIVSGSTTVVSFDPSYNGTYTFKLFANNGQFAEKAVAFTVPTPVIGPPTNVGLDRRIVMGGLDQSGVTEYINGTTPTFKWKPYLGTGYWYRVRVWDLKQPNRLRCWYQSPFAQGVAVDQDMTATVPGGALKDNSNYLWEIEVSTTDQFWTTQHIARSTAYNFYTAAKGSDPMPAGSVYVYSNRSFANGDQTIFGAMVPGFARFDIKPTPTPFQVFASGVTPYNFVFNNTQGGSNDMGYYVPQPNPPNNYSAPTLGIVSGTTTYTFSISDGTTSYTEDLTFTPSLLVLQVTKDEMTPLDNSYLNTLEPGLSWKSKGAGFYHRVQIVSWNGLTIYQSDWTNGVSTGTQMSVAVPPNTLQNGVYRWWVEVADVAGGAVVNRTQSQRQTITLNAGAQGGVNYMMQAWGTGKNKLAAAFNNYGAGNGIWSTPDGASWTKLTDWVPNGMGAWGDGNLVGLFTTYGSGNGLWNNDGAQWTKMTDWILDEGEAYGGNKFAASFINYGSGNGIWSWDGSTWTKLTDWIPDELVAWGTNQLAAKFSNYGSGNGIWSFNGSAWTKLSDWIPFNDMVAWGTGSLAAIFTNYGAGNGIWNFDGTGWAKLTDWVPDGMLAVGTTTLGAGFSNYGSGNGVWGYNGAWAKITDWIPDSGVSWGTGTFAGVFTNYGAGNGIWNFTGAWSKASDWIPAQELN